MKRKVGWVLIRFGRQYVVGKMMDADLDLATTCNTDFQIFVKGGKGKCSFTIVYIGDTPPPGFEDADFSNPLRRTALQIEDSGIIDVQSGDKTEILKSAVNAEVEKAIKLIEEVDPDAIR